ncbi:MAG: hypothetical protein R6V85_21705 [Polyangia bacterium]
MRFAALALCIAALSYAGCGGGSPSSPDAGPDSGGSELIIEPEIPLAECDVVFDRVYEIPGVASASASSVVELPSGHFVMAGTATPEEQTTPWDRDGFLMEVDEEGEMVWTMMYGKENAEDESNDTDTLSSILAFGDNIVALGRKEEDSEPGIWAMRTELDGEVVWSQKLPLDGWGNSAYKAGDAEIVFLAGNAAHHPVIAEIDTSGNLDVLHEEEPWPEDTHVGVYAPLSWGGAARGGWRHEEVEGGANYEPDYDKYEHPVLNLFDQDHTLQWSIEPDPGRSGAFSQAVETSDGKVLAGGWLLYDDWFYGAYLAEVTVEGEVLWQRFYGYNNVVYLSDITPVDDDFLLTTDCGNGYGASNGSVARVDGDGELLWHWETEHTGSAHLNDAIETTSGDYLFCGADDDGVPADGIGNRIWLLKITPNVECY